MRPVPVSGRGPWVRGIRRVPATTTGKAAARSAGTAPKTSRHEACSTRKPAIPGPTRDGTIQAADSEAKIGDWRSVLTLEPTIAYRGTTHMPAPRP